MKKGIKSYITFSHTEKTGLVALLMLLLLFLIIRATMSLWVHPADADTEQRKKMTAAWERFKRAEQNDDTAKSQSSPEQGAFYKGAEPMPDTIDLNKADSVTLIRLKGIGPATAHRIIVWRKENGLFTDIEQLKETGRFNEELFGLLKKHLVITSK